MTFINVETDPALLLVRGPAAASANSEKLNAAMRTSTLNKPFFFPAGDWYFGADTVNSNINGTCILTPEKSGFRFVGGGINRPSAEDDDGYIWNGPRIIYGGPKLSLASLPHSVAD